MQVIKSECNVYIDVDETLVLWGKAKKGDKLVHVTCPYSKDQLTLKKHLGHIKILKDRKARGATITVWSAGGYRWAEAVVRALDLTQYVDFVASKPYMYIDDLKAKDIMGEHLYLPPDSKYGI